MSLGSPPPHAHIHTHTHSHHLPQVTPRHGSADVPFPANNRNGDNYKQNYSGWGRHRYTNRNGFLQFQLHVSKDPSVTFKDARITEKMLSEIPLINQVQTPEGLSSRWAPRPPFPSSAGHEAGFLMRRIVTWACSGRRAPWHQNRRSATQKHGRASSQSAAPQIVRHLKQNVSQLPSGVPAN